MSVKIDNKLILDSALHIAERDGFVNITREPIALHANCSVGKVSNAFGTMTQLRRAVMRRAIKCEILPIIAEGIMLRMACCNKISSDLKKRAIDSIVDRE